MTSVFWFPIRLVTRRSPTSLIVFGELSRRRQPTTYIGRQGRMRLNSSDSFLTPNRPTGRLSRTSLRMDPLALLPPCRLMHVNF